MKILKNKKYSFYKNYQDAGTKTALELIEAIKRGLTKKEQHEYREAIRSGLQADLKALKDKFPAYTPSGQFHGARKLGTSLTYSQEINIDIDKLSVQGRSIDEVFTQLIRDPSVMLVHKSVGGNGLSVTMKVNSPESDHVPAFIQCQRYVEWKYKIKTDPSCKDITRLRYIPHDPDIYSNPDSQIFKVIPPEIYSKLESEERFTRQKREFKEGDRNNFIHLFACNCNRVGISKNFTLDYAFKYFASGGIDQQEIGRTVESGYSHKDEHGISAESAESVESASSALVTSTQFLDTPCFEDWIFQKLPVEFDFIRKLAADNRERDVMLIGSIGILSGVFSTVSGTHTGKQVWSNLYFALYAPAGSGKGQLGFPYRVGRVIHDRLRKECDALKQLHKQACEACKKDENCAGDPPKPRCKGLFIKGDISTSALKDYLNAGEYNVIFETESYVMSKNKGKDWANSEDVMLSTWEHEPIGKLRVDDEKDVEVVEPKLSIVVSGTPHMLQDLIQSVHSGFFSRTCFYVFAQELIFKDQFSERHELAPEHIQKAQALWLEVFEFNRNHPTTILLTGAQRKAHFDLYTAWTEDLNKSGIDRELFSSIVRNGRDLFKLVMIFSAIRRCRENNREEVFTCHDDDFEIARSISTVLYEHAKLVFVFLSKRARISSVNDKDRLLGLLPMKFQREDVIVEGMALGFAERTLDGWISSWLDSGKVIRTKHGKYEVANSTNSQR